mgnify:CR=1 FL=1
MNLKRGLALGVGLLLFFEALVAPFAGALTVTPTVMLDDSPLFITAYARTSAGLQFVQLYNDGDVPLNVNDWKVTNELAQPLVISNVNGWLAPKTHVIASLPGVVVGASATIAALSFGSSAKLSVVPPSSSGYKQVEYELKAAGTTVWRRTTTTTGYSSSTTSFTAYAEQSLFDDGWYVAPLQPALDIVEIYPYASDCAPQDQSVLCGDYVKLFNSSAQDLLLDDYVLRTDSSSSTRTSSNTLSLDGVSVPAGQYHTVWLTDGGTRMNLTNSGGYIWLEDKWELMTYQPVTRYESAGTDQQGYAWAKKADGTWAWTSSPQPLSANNFPVVLAAETDVLAECPAGKYRNPETNRCRTIEEAVNALATCSEGQIRNPDTNRCRSIATTAVASLTPCKEGQERNTETNRCRSIASAVAELMPCDEGYERNPATNRCRKVLQSLSTPASVAEAISNPENNAALPWVLLVASMGVAGYGVYEWRSEITGGFSRLVARFKK